MKILRQFSNLLNHPLNKDQKTKTLFRIIWWKINKVFFKVPAIIEMTKGAKLICYPDSSYGSFVVYAKFPEFEEMDFIKNMVSDGDCVFDVGANIGAISILAASRGKKVKVFSFEPTKELLPFINDNLSINKFNNRIEVFQKAISNKNGKVDFILEGESEINHIATKEGKNKKSIKVDCITLDKFVTDKSINRINFLKIDVEGAEPLVLKGSLKLLDKNKIDIILFEVNKKISNFGYNEKKIIDYLKDKNFFVFEFENNKLSLVNNKFKVKKTTNLVAVLKEKRVIKKIYPYL